MMLSDEEKNAFIQKYCKTRMTLFDLVEAIERAVLAKASQQVQGDPFGWLWLHANGTYANSIFNSEKDAMESWGPFSSGGKAIPFYRKAMPAPKQEPVHWRAVLSDSDMAHHTDESRHIVGFTRLSDAEEWVSAERDFRGWNYTIEPLYLNSVTAQANKKQPVAWRRYAGIVCGSACFTYRESEPVQDDGFEWHPLYYHTSTENL